MGPVRLIALKSCKLHWAHCSSACLCDGVAKHDMACCCQLDAAGPLHSAFTLVGKFVGSTEFSYHDICMHCRYCGVLGY